MSQPKVNTLPNKKSFGNDVIKLASGTTLAQAFGIVSSLFLTRLFTPNAFGAFSVFSSIAGIISIISCLSYESSIVLPKKDEDASNQLGLCVIISLLISSLLLPIIWFCGDWILDVLNAPELSFYLWFLPFIILLGGMSAGHPGLNYWNFRKKKFFRQSLVAVVHVIITSVVQLSIGFSGFNSAGGLIIGAGLGSAASSVWLGLQIWRDDSLLFIRSIRWRRMLYGIKRYRKFPIYMVGATLLNTISWQLPTFMLSIYFSTSEVGFYALGFKVLSTPMNLIGNSIRNVFYPRVVNSIRTNSLNSLVKALFRRLIVFTLFPLVTLTFIGRDMFSLIFGQQWAEAGVYAQILSPFIFVWFISSPLSVIYLALEKQDFLFKFNLIVFITRIISISVGAYFGGPYLVLLLFTISGIITYGYLIFYILIISGISWTKIIAIFYTNVLYSLPFVAILILINVFEVKYIVNLAISFFLVCVYLLLMVNKDKEIKKEILQLRIIEKINGFFIMVVKLLKRLFINK